MKLALFADGFVGERIAEDLLGNFVDDLCFVVTICENSISEIAQKSGITHYLFNENDRIKLALEEVDLGVLAWWPKIIKQDLLMKPRSGFVNTHPSLLPFNRGKHYNFWAIVEEAPFGVSIHAVEKGIDTGAVLFQKKIEYDWCDTGETLYNKAMREMVELWKKSYPLLRSGDYEKNPQDLEKGSFHLASELDEASRIDLEATYKGKDLLNLLRARTFEGHPGSWFEVDGKRYEISITINKK